MADEEIRLTRSANRPSLLATASATETWADPSLAGTGLTTNALSQQSRFAGLTGAVPLIVPGQRAQLRRSEAEADAAAFAADATRQDLILAVILAFATVEETGAIASLARRRAEEGEAAAVRMERRQAEGYASRLDVAAAWASVTDLQAAAAAREADHAEAQLRLSALTGAPVPAALTPLAAPRIGFTTAEEAISLAAVHHPEAELFRQRTASAQARLEAAKGARMPRVSATGTAGWQEATGFDGRSRAGEVAALGLTLDMPLLTGGQIGASRRIARAGRAAAMAIEQEQADQRDLAVRLAFMRWQSARDAVGRARSIEEARRGILTGRKRAYAEKQVSLDTVFAAEQDLIDAMTRRISAAAEETRAGYTLLHAAGILEGAHSASDTLTSQTEAAPTDTPEPGSVLAAQRMMRR